MHPESGPPHLPVSPHYRAASVLLFLPLCLRLAAIVHSAVSLWKQITACLSFVYNRSVAVPCHCPNEGKFQTLSISCLTPSSPLLAYQFYLPLPASAASFPTPHSVGPFISAIGIAFMSSDRPNSSIRTCLWSAASSTCISTRLPSLSSPQLANSSHPSVICHPVSLPA